MTNHQLRSLPSTTPHPQREPAVRKRGRSRGERRRPVRMQLEPYLDRAGCTTLRQLAAVVGVNDKHLSRVINGSAYLTEGLQARLSSHLALTSDEANHAFGLPGWTPSTNRSEQKGALDGGAPRPLEHGHLRLVSRPPALET